MEFSAKQIASFIGGKVEGDENATVNSFAKNRRGQKRAQSHSCQTLNTSITYMTRNQA